MFGSMTALPLLAALAAQTTLADNRYAIDEPLPLPALVWSDEFDGDTLDASKWSYETEYNRKGWFNEELQYYSANRPKNLRVGNGLLTIELHRDPDDLRKFADWGGQKYSSARITTSKHATFSYGFYEIRARVPCARGTWPAVWMLPEIADMRWPDDGEIDILEHIGADPGVAYATLHTGLYNHAKNTQRGGKLSVPTACSNFHRYQMLWQPDAITMAVDDRAYMRVRNNEPGGRGAWPFDRPFYMIVNLAMGGGWAGSKGIDDAALPQKFEVDYIRVWKLPEVNAASRR